MKLKECYEAMNGDYDYMMERLPREASIIKYLRRFAENTEYAELKAAYTEKNYRRIFELSHDLKGMAANLSLPGFQKAMSDICEQTRDREPDAGFEALLDTAEAEYNKLIEAISQLEDAQ